MGRIGRMNMPKQGYKIVKTLFGNEEIPEEWSIKNLGTISELFIPMRDKPKQFDGDIPWLRIEDLDDKFASDSKSHQRVSKNIVEKMNLRIYPVGTVLCSCSATIGVCAITTRELITNQTFIGIYPTSQLNKEFLYYYLLTQKNNLKRIGSGSTILYISREKFEGFPIIIPPLNEQQKIASVLSNIDSLIQQTQKIIEQTQNLKKGLMQKLFTKGIKHAKFVKSEIGLIPKEWELVPLEDACLTSKNSFSMGPFGSDIKTDNFVPVGVPVIRGVNLTKEPFNEDGFVFITEEKADELRAANAFPNDLIFTHRGTLGQVGIIPPHAKFKRYVISQSQMKCVCNDEMLNPMFAFYYFLSEIGQKIMLKHSTKSGVPHIVQPLTSLRRLLIPVPNLEEQNKIVEILCDVSMLIDKRLAYKLHLESLKKGLMQKLLTGQIRVKI